MNLLRVVIVVLKSGINKAAWGNNGLFLDRDKALKELLPTVKMMCFKITQAGQPIHPLSQRSNSVLIEYK